LQIILTDPIYFYSVAYPDPGSGAF
jgi:hypothetical protein